MMSSIARVMRELAVLAIIAATVIILTSLVETAWA
jgi:hypothetical protein